MSRLLTLVRTAYQWNLPAIREMYVRPPEAPLRRAGASPEVRCRVFIVTS